MSARTASFFSGTDFNVKDATRMDRVRKEVQAHLKKVYATLTLGAILAASGAWLALTNRLPGILQMGFLNTLICFGLIIAISVSDRSESNSNNRLAMYSVLTFLIGTSLDTLLAFAIHVDPAIPAKAFAYTTMIFASFTLVALMSPDRREFLYLGSFLFSCLNLLVIMSFANMFFGSKLLDDINIYGGLVLFCAYVIFDTQFVIAKFEMGDTDHITHALHLFLDAVNIFVRIVRILTDRENDNRRRRN